MTQDGFFIENAIACDMCGTVTGIRPAIGSLTNHRQPQFVRADRIPHSVMGHGGLVAALVEIAPEAVPRRENSRIRSVHLPQQRGRDARRNRPAIRQDLAPDIRNRPAGNVPDRDACMPIGTQAGQQGSAGIHFHVHIPPVTGRTSLRPCGEEFQAGVGIYRLVVAAVYGARTALDATHAQGKAVAGQERQSRLGVRFVAAVKPPVGVNLRRRHDVPVNRCDSCPGGEGGDVVALSFHYAKYPFRNSNSAIRTAPPAAPRRVLCDSPTNL